MAWRTPIYDRTQQDVDYVIELAEKLRLDTITSEEYNMWRRTQLKGSLNSDDIVRVRDNIAYLAEKTYTSIDTDYSGPSYFKDVDYQRLLNNLNAIRNGYLVYWTTPQTPIRPLNTYQKWNDIEKIIADIKELVDNNVSASYYANDNYYGDDNFLI